MLRVFAISKDCPNVRICEKLGNQGDVNENVRVKTSEISCLSKQKGNRQKWSESIFFQSSRN